MQVLELNLILNFQATHCRRTLLNLVLRILPTMFSETDTAARYIWYHIYVIFRKPFLHIIL
jgi:hypothetical protein